MYEYTNEKGVKKEAVLLCFKPHNYSDAKRVFFLESPEAAKAIAKEINDARVHPFSDYAEVTEVPNGAVLVVTEPYDD